MIVQDIFQFSFSTKLFAKDYTTEKADANLTGYFSGKKKERKKERKREGKKERKNL